MYKVKDNATERYKIRERTSKVKTIQLFIDRTGSEAESCQTSVGGIRINQKGKSTEEEETTGNQQRVIRGIPKGFIRGRGKGGNKNNRKPAKNQEKSR